MTLDALEFIRRFLQHILPTGLQKVRHFGFLSPNSDTALEVVRWLVTAFNGALYILQAERAEGPAPISAPLPHVRPSDVRPGIRAAPVPAVLVFETS